MFYKNFIPLLLVCLALPATINAAAQNVTCSVKKTNQYICNTERQRGMATKPVTAIKTTYDGSYQQCVQLLHRTGKAKSASYGAIDELEEIQCNLFDVTAKQQGYKANSSSEFSFFDKPCLSCQSCEVGFQNGGFETGKFPPWANATYDTNGSAAITSDAHSGHFAVKISAPIAQANSQQPFVEVYQFFSTCPDQNYTVSFYFKANAATRKGYQDINFYSQAPERLYAPPPYTGGWQFGSYTFTSDDVQTAISFTGTSSDTERAHYVIIDDVTVT